MNMAEALERDARQIIVKALAKRDNLTLNSTILNNELVKFGIDELPEWVADQIDWLERMGMVTYRIEGDKVRIVTLLEKGVHHVAGRRKIDGVGRPSLASLGVDLIAANLKNGGS